MFEGWRFIFGWLLLCAFRWVPWDMKVFFLFSGHRPALAASEEGHGVVFETLQHCLAKKTRQADEYAGRGC